MPYPVMFYAACLVISALVVVLRLDRRRFRAGRAPVDQVAVVNQPNVVWRRKRVVNMRELAVCNAARGALVDLATDCRVWPQVSLGAAVRTEGREEVDKLASRYANSKRCDFVIVDATGLPLAVIAFQGAAHQPGNAAEREAMMRSVLPRAGIGYIEVAAGMAYTPRKLRAHLAERLRPLVPAPIARTPIGEPASG